jgi:hemerythrin
MPIIHWDNRFATGIAQIDEHHLYLFVLLQKFHNNCINGVPCQRLSVLFDEIVEYALYHFSVEERLMEEHKYHLLETHKKEHFLFSEKLRQKLIENNCDNLHLLIETFAYMHDWLQAHVLQSDIEFGLFVASCSPCDCSSHGVDHKTTIEVHGEI